MESQTVGLVRGCGTRKAGGVYAEVALGPNGQPIEHFLVDSPVVIDADALGISSIGVKLIPRNLDADGVNPVYDVWDIVGQDSYPNVADFIEETRRFGVSRRLAKTLDFSLLTPGSRLILLHQRAFINNPADYIRLTSYECPKGKPEHEPTMVPAPHCLGLAWSDIEPAEKTVGDEESTEEKVAEDWKEGQHPYSVTRTMPAFSYTALRRPDGVKPDYKLAIFASFPIHNLAVINDPVGDTHESAMEAASKAGLNVTLEDE